MRRSGRHLSSAVLAVSAAAVLAACGGSSKSSKPSGGGQAAQASSDPQTLIHQTFAGHKIKSGVANVSIVVTPKGSSVLTTPLSLTVTGPFQGAAKGQNPQADLTITASGAGKKGSFGVVTTSKAAYARLQGVAYMLPAKTVKQLRQSTANGSGGAPGLSSLGIDPSTWLTNPKIVGTATVDGAPTEHLQAGVDVNAMLADVNKVLAKQSHSSSTMAHVPQISAATMKKIAAAVQNPTVDIWTGKSDSTLRRMTVSASVPVSGAISTRLGGMTSASFRLDAQYSQLNQPQTISAPANPHSYAELQAKIQSLGQQLLGGLGAGSLGSGATGSTGSGSTGSTNPGSGIPSAAATQKYSKCVNAAGGDVSKIQKCAKLLKAGG